MNIIYELAYLISSQLDESKALEFAKNIEKKVSENGTILNSIEPKKIKLAYLIKKQQEAFLVSLDFTTEAKNILIFSKEMEKEADVLRFLFIKKSPKKPEEPREERKVKEIEKTETVEEKPQAVADAPKKEKVKKEKPVEKEAKEEDLKKIEKDLDEILGA